MKRMFQNKKNVVRTVLSAFALILALVVVVSMQNAKKNKVSYDETSDEYRIAKLLKAREPNVVGSNDDISFKAFFLRDEDGDGYTEDLDEIDQVIGNTDYMFVEVNVKSEGQLKNGKITINDSNFKDCSVWNRYWSTNLYVFNSAINACLSKIPPS